MSKENFTRTIMLEMYDKDGKPVKKSVQVLLDTGNPLNVLSWKTVKTYGLERLVHGGPRTGLKTMGGHEFTSIGRIKGRVLVETNDPRWLDAEFEVSASDDHYDVVLGSEFLAEHHLVQVSKKFPPAYSGFRTKPAEYTGK